MDFEQKILFVLKNNLTRILLISSIVGLFFFGGSFLITPQYTSEATLRSKEMDNSKNSQLAQLASLASSLPGLTETSSSNSISTSSIDYVRSYDFFQLFISEESRLERMFRDKFTIDFESLDNFSFSYEFMKAHEQFNKQISFDQDIRNGLFYASLRTNNRDESAKLLREMIGVLDNHLREKEISVSSKSIDYLKNELVQTTNMALKNSLVAVLNNQMENKALAEISDDYIFEYIDSPRPPLKKSFPVRWVFLMLGFFISFVALFFYFVNKAGKHNKLP